jgi:CMP-N,N'-diacetyllegionaminic acid synthase
VGNRTTITAIIPARAGSKGIPGKNLWSHDGVSLLARAIRLGHHCERVDRVIVSTDSADMQALALAEAAECPALRPAELASDTATSASVVRHVIETLHVTSDHILLLQVTAPLRTLADCNAFLDHYLSASAPAATSLVKLDEPRPEKLKKLQAGLVVPYLGTNYEGPRQALPQPYALNGAFYAIRRDVFLQQEKFLPEGTIGYEMPPERSHNLDTPQDLQILEAMLGAGFWQMENLPHMPVKK